MYIERVHIQDLRCFADATIEFEHPDREGSSGPLPNVTLLLGNNGVGKTTVLRAVALGALNVALAQSGYVPYSMVRRAKLRSPDKAYIQASMSVHGQDLTGNLNVRISGRLRAKIELRRRADREKIAAQMDLATRHDEDTFEEQLDSDDSPGILVLGYGATRRVEPASEFSPSRRRKSRVLRYERVSSLFEEQVALAPLAYWLPDLRREKPKLYKSVCALLDQLIPELRFTGELEADEYLFERHGVKIGFTALSDGYRGYIGLLGDFFYHLCRGLKDGDDPTQSRGIVLIDEIDQHLHPTWQREVVPTLANNLPNLQFVLTTHSPIIAGTVYAKNIRLLEPDEDGLSRLEPLDDVEEIHGLNADQILLTEAFGLESSRAPDFVEKLARATRELDPDDWQDALRIMRLLNRGSAGEAPPELAEAPAWAKKAARDLAGIVGAEDRPTAKKRSAKRRPGTKVAKKKPSKR